MTVLYDTITTDTRETPPASVYYTTNATTDGLVYPTSDTYNVMGPLYLPKIYGKDLTSFELCSSGSIAVTLSDVYSFDLSRPDSSTVLFKTQQNDKLVLASGSNAAAVTIDGSLNNVTVAASNQINIASAGSNATIQLDGTNSNVTLYAAKNVTETAAGDFNIWGANVFINGKLMASSDSNNPLFFGDCNAYIMITDSNMDIYTKNRVRFMMSNNSYYDNNNDFVFNTGHLEYTSYSNTSFQVNKDFSLTAKGVVQLSNALDMDLYTGGTMNLQSYGVSGTTLSAQSGPMVISTPQILTVNNGGENKTNTQSFVHHMSHSNVQLSTDLHIDASSSALFSAGSTSTTTAQEINLFASDVLTTTSTNTSASASVNITLSAGQSNILTSSNMSVTTALDAMHAIGRDFDITAGNDVNVSAATMIFLTAPTISNVSTNEYDNVSHNKTAWVGGNVSETVVGDYGLTALTAEITATSTGSITFGSDFVIKSATAKNSIDVNDTTSIITATAGNNKTLTISPSNVLINGELRVNGDIISVSTYQENLEVFDKTITLAGGASNTFADGPLTNDKSGIIIPGFPSTDGSTVLPTMLDPNTYEKSILLHVPSTDAMKHLLDQPTSVANYPVDSFNLESYWEVKGGDLRMTLERGGGNFTTFGWRIGAYDELELIKSWSHANGTSGSRVVSKFGRVTSGSTIM